MMKSSECMIKIIIILSMILFSLTANSQEKVSKCVIKGTKNSIYVVAHRGAHTGIPENSIAAYQKAIDLGCDFVEIDVRTTRDGRFVSIHNSSVEKYVPGLKAKVKDLNFAELRSLDIGINIGPQWKGTQIPSFEEILDLCHGKIGIYLDLKSAPVTKLVEIIKEKGMEKEILWYIPVSDSKDLAELKSSCPECLPMPDAGSENNIKSTVEKFIPCVIATDMNQLNEKFVNTAHGYNTMVITDEKEGTAGEWKKILNWQTDGIQTDHPEELISFLKSHEVKSF
jgi:glycerophosphoryl diester phosphodiesterase